MKQRSKKTALTNHQKLCAAIYQDFDISVIKNLIQKVKADNELDKLDLYGKSPLYLAVEQENLKAIKLLIDNGANLDLEMNNHDIQETDNTPKKLAVNIDLDLLFLSKVKVLVENKVSQEEELKKLNAAGDDRNLAEDGNNKHYWYSINDVMTLLIHTRQEVLQYNNQVQPGEEFAAIRQNQNGIFLADPYHTANFAEYLNNDISRIIGNHSVEAQNSYVWHNMPRLIVIPLLSGMHWRAIAIQINYENNNVNIIWDDPYGNFLDPLKQNLLGSIKVNVLKLLNKEGVADELTEENVNISQEENIIDQQGRGQNGWDCGPITVSNIKDYISHYVANSNLTGINYTVGRYDEENHEDTVKDIRINHLNQYGNIAEIEIDEDRLNDIRLTWENNKATQLKQVDLQFSEAISQLDDFYLNMFFTIVENYQMLTQKNYNEAIEYALNFVTTEKTKEIIQIQSIYTQQDVLSGKDNITTKLGLHKRSITPTTLKKIIFDNPDKDLFYKEIYQYENDTVTRFAIRDLKVQDFNFSTEKDSKDFRGNKEKLSMSGKTDKFKNEVSKIQLNSFEKKLLEDAVNDLLSNNNKHTVLLDIFARTNGEIKLDKDGNIETHTVVLYKNPPKNGEGVHEIAVIDPSNFRFSSHLANPVNYSFIKNEKFGDIKASYDNKQIYTPGKSTGPEPDQFRDCIDIAVKLALGMNIKKDINFNKILELDIIQEITNNPEVNTNIIDLDASVRIKQATQSFIRKNFELLVDKAQKLFKHFVTINDEQKSEEYRIYEQKYKELLAKNVEFKDYSISVIDLKNFHDEFYDNIKSLMGEQHEGINLSNE